MFGYIYVIRQLDSNYMFSTPARRGCSYKIGRTKERSPRFKAISLLLPHKTEFVLSLPTDLPWAETYLHQVLAPVRMNGEWFALYRHHLLWLVALGSPHGPGLDQSYLFGIEKLYEYYEEYCSRDPE